MADRKWKIITTCAILLALISVSYAQPIKPPTTRGVFLADDGVLATPGFSFFADPDTGWYRAGSGNLCYSFNATQGPCFNGTSFGSTGGGNLTNVFSAAYSTSSNCSDVGSPSACAGASAGSTTIAAGATSKVVNTTAVTANSQILITEDQSLGTRLSVTCNTQSDLTVGTPEVSARTAGTSFTVIVPVAPTTNPVCFNFLIIN